MRLKMIEIPKDEPPQRFCQWTSDAEDFGFLEADTSFFTSGNLRLLDHEVKQPSDASPPSDLKATLQRASTAGGSQVSAFLAECFHHFECGGHQYSWPIWLRPENLRDAQVTWPEWLRLVISWFLSKQDCVFYITKPKHLTLRRDEVFLKWLIMRWEHAEGKRLDTRFQRSQGALWQSFGDHH